MQLLLGTHLGLTWFCTLSEIGKPTPFLFLYLQ